MPLNSCYISKEQRDVSGGSVVKNPPANGGDMDLIPGPKKNSHAMEQLSPCVTTSEPT